MDSNRGRLSWVGQTVGALGVIASLIFVALEIRQNTEAVRSATIQAISDQSLTSVTQLLENDSLQAAFQRVNAGQPLTSDQSFRLRIYYTGLMRIQQNRYLQARLGILDIETLLFTGGRGGSYSSPYFPVFWSEVRGEYPEEFATFVDTALIANPLPDR